MACDASVSHQVVRKGNEEKKTQTKHKVLFEDLLDKIAVTCDAQKTSQDLADQLRAGLDLVRRTDSSELWSRLGSRARIRGLGGLLVRGIAAPLGKLFCKLGVDARSEQSVLDGVGRRGLCKDDGEEAQLGGRW
jgi:hypothetical protein